eukprot:TRINITY_DN10054_c0_g1_i1.p1 TRINITY_DN10054_c0_g1~~TRINITY_DN10054_c0_g1_i1.p1  ORF type:complete len:531 (+),score=197.56 TRINITY_DN10054_c0_g1_i1:53-1594(+)
MERGLSAGRVKGQEGKQADIYYGIPYAQSPTGKLRFRRPQPVATWAGTLDASQPPKELPQSSIPGMELPLSNPGKPVQGELPSNQSEDALLVNVFAPKGGAVSKAVMVWIHGGAFESGAGYLPIYSGERLAISQDCVVVSLNYRVGCFGFLYKRGAGFDANVGLHDQIAALKWIQKEISSFGGDPARVTVFGESAGAMSITALLASPLAKGLFRGAICQSGGPCALITEAEAEKTAEHLSAALGIPFGSLTAEKLQSIPAKEMVDAAAKMRFKALHVPMCWAPVHCDPLWPQPLAAINAGASQGVTILSGIMREEFRLFLLGVKGKFDPARTTGWLKKRVEATCPALVGEAAVAKARGIVDHEVGAGRKGRLLFEKVCGDFTFAVPHERLLDAHRGTSYSYRMDWASKNKMFGATHVVDIPFVFGTHQHPMIKMFAGGNLPEADAFNSLVMSIWGTFAKNLHPRAPGVSDWPPHDTLARPTMVLGADNKAKGVLHYQLNKDLVPWSAVLQPKL